MLQEYRKKRSFDKTPEPTGGKAAGKKLIFVVQKHDASRLHYDFRLEMDGVLKSWAIPKGPSLDPQDKRLAMMVEDHPYNYRDFEGIIPEGNYGAGTVIVWDTGTYEPLENAKTKAAAEKILEKELKAGSIKIRLHGKKLQGEFALVHIHGREENAWLLIKHKDEFAAHTDITKKEKSVLSGKTLHQVETSKGSRLWESDRKKTAAGAAPTATTLGKKAAMPVDIKPMLATLVDRPFDGKDWLYEIKWDGYRAVSYLKKGKADIQSRNNLSFNDKFSSIKDALSALGLNAVLDGEIVALNDDGLASFQQLQGYLKHGKATPLAYYVFDILWYEGRDLTHLPLTERKEILRSILPEEDDVIRYSGHIMEKGKEFFEAALKKGLEGIMAKKSDSEYTIAHRTQSWLKIKNNHRMEAIIAGFTAPRESRKYFGAVILGKYKGDKLQYIGHSGSGFDQQGLKDLYKRFQPLITESSPFASKPKTNMPATWLRPELVCEVKFTEVTGDGLLRHPIFLGLRDDKKGSGEKNEKVVHAPVSKRTKTAAVIKDAKSSSKPRAVAAKGTKAPAAAKNRAADSSQLITKGETDKEVTIGKHVLPLTNLQKTYWKKEKISKGDTLNYYHSIAEYILPYLEGRPQSMNRFPNGIEGEHFYNKNVGANAPSWIKTLTYAAGDEGKSTKYLVATGEDSLLYMANLGCIEMNPWHSRARTPEKPDWCVIDLDPDKTNTFRQVMEAAAITRDFLDSVGVTSWCKTSGSTGMHIYIPLGAKYSYDQSKMLAELVVNFVHEQIPGYTSLERSPAKRRGKLYLDFLQNRPTQTIAAPYSLRPKPGATVSMPLHWEELKPSLKIADFTIANALDRIKNEGDIFKPVLGKGIDMKKTIDLIQSS